MGEERLKINLLRVVYSPTRMTYDDKGNRLSIRGVLGRRTIEAEHMPDDLRDKLIEFVKGVEGERSKR